MKPEEDIILHAVPFLPGESLPITVDFSKTKPIKNGLTLAGTPTIEVLLDGIISPDLAVSNAGYDSTKTKVNFILTNISAAVPEAYYLGFSIPLSDGLSNLVEGLNVEVQLPSGTMKAPC
jgi:hypothetical protein